MTTLSQASVTDGAETEHLRPSYLQALALIERLHRRLLDVVRDEMDREGRADINAVQALLLFNIGDAELSASELRKRGYYLGSNVSYNVKKLVEAGFLHHQRSTVDRRAVRISLTEKGQGVRKMVEDLYDRHLLSIEKVGEIDGEGFSSLIAALNKLERFWTDQIRFKL